MSDEDAAKDDTNTDAAAKAEAARPQAGSDADVTAKFDSGDTGKGAAAESAASKAEASKTEAGKSDADKNAAAETVKMKSAASGDEPTVKLDRPTAPAAVAAPTGGGGRSTMLPIIGAFAAGVVLVAAIAVAAVSFWQASDRGGQLDARDESTKAACDFGRQVGTYDAKNFDDYVKRVKDRSTGDWATQFEAASSALKDITTQAQARSGIDEIHCAWESGDDDKATVIMLITQNQSKAAAPQPQHITIGVVATMEKKGDKWLASSFQSPMMNDMGPIPAPGEQAPSGQAPAPQPGG
ncbi:hypothetical protein [Nocardia blacklockiae]|uniref:hypothetical protein n=1 Tax=Nocardia blacklockiae TaxID=480036 RepID=UPI001893C68D|nr:hypothetical protein [Nocardia blacklockiae]MBF6176463.1 hypothetical protein [Nocardia blacklockiae]